MKFITEADLRDLYRKEAFHSYQIPEGARLTPGARQFLADKRIETADCTFFSPKIEEQKKEERKQEQSDTVLETMNLQQMKKIRCKFQSVEALFLLTCEELLNRDVILAQKLLELCKKFTLLKKSVGESVPEIAVICQECTGIKEKDFCQDCGDCFEITPFHIQLEKGKEILLLHRLRCALREIEPVLDESQKDSIWNKNAVNTINQMIHILSQMICTAVGGKECQRKEGPLHTVMS